jgi:hypothetical protein
VSCQNGVTACVNGTCQCPTGYSGNYCELSTISFRNNTYTPIYLNVSGYPDTIPPDSTVSYYGTSGEALTISAFTFGTNPTTNLPVGDTIPWSLNDNFPVNGLTHTDTFNVNTNYFFLKLIDSSTTQSITSIDVNFNIMGAQTLNNVAVPNDKKVHGIGYYVNYPLTQIKITSNTGYNWIVTPPTIPDTIINEAITVAVN